VLRMRMPRLRTVFLTRFAYMKMPVGVFCSLLDFGDGSILCRPANLTTRAP
jgi:hypothetical protein